MNSLKHLQEQMWSNIQFRDNREYPVRFWTFSRVYNIILFNHFTFEYVRDSIFPRAS